MLLKDLSVEEKLFLIELLVKSIQKGSAAPQLQEAPYPDQNDSWVQHFAGSWSDLPGTAEEMITLIEGARTMSRPIETL